MELMGDLEPEEACCIVDPALAAAAAACVVKINAPTTAPHRRPERRQGPARRAGKLNSLLEVRQRKSSTLTARSYAIG